MSYELEQLRDEEPSRRETRIEQTKATKAMTTRDVSSVVTESTSGTLLLQTALSDKAGREGEKVGGMQKVTFIMAVHTASLNFSAETKIARTSRLRSIFIRSHLGKRMRRGPKRHISCSPRRLDPPLYHYRQSSGFQRASLWAVGL